MAVNSMPVKKAVAHGLRLVEEGANLLDIGGESTRPGAREVPVAEEYARVIPVVEELAREAGVPVSIDTRKPEIARAAYEAGATIWNDVSALTYSENSLKTAVDLGIRVVLMHAQGTPETMQDDPAYDDPVEEIRVWLRDRIEQCGRAGLSREQIIVDPGIGFGKTLDHNLALLDGLSQFQSLGCPVLLGASRKSYIGKIDEKALPDQRLGGSLATVYAAALRDIDMVRVHDVAETRQALALFSAIEGFTR